MSIDEAARLLGVNPNTVRSWLRDGTLADLEHETVETLRKRIYAA